MRIVGGLWRGRALGAPAGRATRPTSDKVREAMFDVLLALPEVREAGAGRRHAGRLRESESGPLAGHLVLDLFAGSGALGLEALSRGADGCTFVESGAPALRALRANLERLGVTTVRPGRSMPLSGAGAAPAPAGGASSTRPEPPTAGAESASIEADSAAPPLAVVLGTDVRRALAADARRDARYTLVFADPPYERYDEVRPALIRLLGRVLAPGAVLVVESAASTTAGLPWPVVREKRYGDTRVTFLAAGAPRPAEGEATDDEPPGT